MNGIDVAGIANLGIAGAVVLVVIVFLNYLTKRDEEWRSFFSRLTEASSKDMSKMSEAMDQVVSSLNSLVKKLEEHDRHVDERVRSVKQAARNNLPRKQ